MASTTKTVNLELSQFVGTDKPAWLTDYNGDMQKIDDGYKKLEDANTATQADLDATKQNLDGSKSDISDLEAEVQALTAADAALQTRATVLEANYDTMHHEVAVNAQDIADMKPYAMIASNKKNAINIYNSEQLQFTVNSSGTEENFVIESIKIDGKTKRLIAGTNSSGRYITQQLYNPENGETEVAPIIYPIGGMQIEYASDTEVIMRFRKSATEWLYVNINSVDGITFGYHASNGTLTNYFKIPIPTP